MEILIQATDIAEKLILLVLMGLSVWSVAIIIDRRQQLRAEKLVPVQKIRDLILARDFGSAKSLCQGAPSLIANSFHQGLVDLRDSEKVERAILSQYQLEKLNLEKGLAVLATLGANAPFVGLLGTVLGIIRAFAYLGSQAGSSSVMSGVSQALYATAMGLFVAIPAVVAFNVFSKQIKDLTVQLESLKDLLISKMDTKG
jgi:biopolymer transport protein ExbB/TolQ